MSGYSQLIRPRISSFTLLTLSSAVVFAVVVLILSSLNTPLPPIEEGELFRSTSGDKQLRSSYLKKVEHRHHKQIAKEVHFLSQVISRNSRRHKNPAEAKDLATLIVQESRSLNYDPLFIASVIKSESSFRTVARSHKGALGLMQILPGTGQYVAKKHDINWSGPTKLINDARYNVRLGVNYIKYLERMFSGDLTRVLAAYNWGPGNVIQSKHSAPPRSVRNYATKILGDYSRWKGEFEKESGRYQFINVNFIPKSQESKLS